MNTKYIKIGLVAACAAVNGTIWAARGIRRVRTAARSVAMSSGL